MVAYQGPTAFPTNRPSSSSSGDRARSLTPRTSSEHGTVCSDETQRTSLTDEAQACFNILLILRQDAQHLISLRNDNLDALEGTSSLVEDDASSRNALLACINESIVAATRSVASLGPYLEKCRWPVATLPSTPTSQRRSFTVTLRPRRPRSQSSSELPVESLASETCDGFPAPEEMFSWTLALTAQHAAVLVATARLGTFLESGFANVSDEERRRREARQSWWEQGRGGFENVGLIQSLLARTQTRTPKEVSEATSAAPTAVTTQALPSMDKGQDVAENNLTPIMENDDWQSEALHSESFPSTPKGLTVRPRHQRMGSWQEDESFSVRRVVVTEPISSCSTEPKSSSGATIARMETFGADKPPMLRPRFSSSRRRTRITSSPLPSTVALQDIVPDQGHACEMNANIDATESEYLSARGSGLQLLTPLLTPTASPEKASTPQADSDVESKDLPPQQKSLSPLPSPDAESPYTPLNHHFTARFPPAQRALALPSSTLPLASTAQDPDTVAGSLITTNESQDGVFFYRQGGSQGA